MLKIKFFKEFKNNFPFLVIIGTQHDYKEAYNLMLNKKGEYLDNKEIFNVVDIAPLSSNMLYLDEEECKTILNIFLLMSKDNSQGHYYFDSKALGDDIEILISNEEYNDLF